MASLEGNGPSEAGLVTVIVPTYNRPRLLVEAMESVRAQCYRPIELFVVDDGSQDDVRSVVAKFAEEAANEQFRCAFLQQQRRGPLVARNAALARSRGEFVQFLDDDDSLHPDKLRLQVERFAQSPEMDTVVSQVAYCDEQMNPSSASRILDRNWSGSMTEFFLDLRHDVAMHAPLHRRSALERIGGWDERVTHGGEVELHLRLAIAGAKFCFLPEVLANVRCHQQPGRLTLGEKTTPVAAEQAFYQRIIDFAETRTGGRDERLRLGVAWRLFGIARRHYANRRVGLATDCVKAAREISADFAPLRARVYPALGGYVGTAFELPRSLLEQAARRAVRLLRRN